MSLVHTKNVQAIQTVTPVMFVKQVTTVYMYFSHSILYLMPVSVNVHYTAIGSKKKYVSNGRATTASKIACHEAAGTQISKRPYLCNVAKKL